MSSKSVALGVPDSEPPAASGLAPAPAPALAPALGFDAVARASAEVVDVCVCPPLLTPTALPPPPLPLAPALSVPEPCEPLVRDADVGRFLAADRGRDVDRVGAADDGRFEDEYVVEPGRDVAALDGRALYPGLARPLGDGDRREDEGESLNMSLRRRAAEYGPQWILSPARGMCSM